MSKEREPAVVTLSEGRALRRGWDPRAGFRDPNLGKFYVLVDGDQAAVRAGRFDVPRQFTIEPGDKSVPIIDVTVEGGRPQCVAVRRRTSAPGLTSKTLRFPLAEFMNAALVALATKPGDGKTETGEAIWQHALASEVREKIEAGLLQRRRGISLSKEVLAAAAEIYRDADQAGEDPVRAVMGVFHCSRSTASRWVRAARELGILARRRASTRAQRSEHSLLPPTDPPKARQARAREEQ